MRKLNIPFDQIKAHYELEKKLSNQLRKASVSERKNLYNDTYNEVYSKVSYLLPLQRKLSSSELKNYLKMLGPYLNKDITFLEIGPGNCILSFAVSKCVKFVYAVDVSTEVTKNSQSPQNFKLIISDGTNIPVPQASINFAYSNQLMEHLHPVCVAGLPVTSAYALTFLVTIAPAPINANSPISIPHKMVAFAPIVAPFFTSVFLNSFFLITALRGLITLVKTIEGPRKTSSSQTTPS